MALDELQDFCRKRGDDLCGSNVFERVCEGRAFREIEAMVARMRRSQRYLAQDSKPGHREAVLRVLLIYLILWSVTQIAWSLYSILNS